MYSSTTDPSVYVGSLKLYSKMCALVTTKCRTGVHRLDNDCTAVQLNRANCLIHKPQHMYEWDKQSVCTCDNKNLSVHRPYWG